MEAGEVPEELQRAEAEGQGERGQVPREVWSR